MFNFLFKMLWIFIKTFLGTFCHFCARYVRHIFNTLKKMLNHIFFKKSFEPQYINKYHFETESF